MELATLFKLRFLEIFNCITSFILKRTRCHDGAAKCFQFIE